MKFYNHNKIEKKWQRWWARKKIYVTKENSKKPKCYVLDMFPYPSGEGLHVGHPKGYIATDIYSRYKRMQGFNVLHPMGWDAFGLPAENYALKNKIHPKVAVGKNIKRYKEQLGILGFNYDWSREINTTDPAYYKWTQWIFLQMWKRGLAYQSWEPINWCPKDKTGLANEDVEDGKCERCGTPVEKRPMRQWVLRITDYAERLLECLEKLEWPESIKELQRNWIGKSEGAEINFPLKSNHNFVLLHGFTATSDDDFHPWLKKKLEELGVRVQCPTLPNTEKPSENEQVLFVLKNVQFDENTVLLGHSLGSVVALKVLEKLDKKIAGLVTVGGFIDPNFKDHDRNFRDRFKWNFDFKKIQSRVGFIRVLHDESDVAITDKQTEALARALGVQAEVCTPNESHFTHEEEPAVFNALTNAICVFTTRADTLFGATYLVLAPEHPLLQNNEFGITNFEEVKKYISVAKNKAEIERTAEGKEKTGVELKGIKAINPANKEEIPIFVADYVLGDYGTGAIMAVPAHDERDFEFAKKYNLPVRMVVCPHYPAPTCPVLDNAYVGEGHLVDSGRFNGMKSEEAKKAIIEFVGGKSVVRYKLRDWVFSRQRYWGEPIPLIHCEKCGVVPVLEKDLPVRLPEVKSYEPTGTGESPLANIKSWMNVKCPECGESARRETNTMPQWAGSSWYYLAYIMRGISNFQFPISKYKSAFEKWLAVDMYVGGAEHATRHLIYARFWHKFLKDIGVVSTDEPFKKLKHVGLISGADGRKMSKRFGNVINPDDVVTTYGADTLRVYEMFMGPFDQGAAWSAESIIGSRRFIEKVWRLGNRIMNQESGIKNGERNTESGVEDSSTQSGGEKLELLIHKTIKKVGEDIETFKFNTAISSLMILVNEIEKVETVSRAYFETLLLLVAPFAPHMAEEIWQQLHILSTPAPSPRESAFDSIHHELWPQFDASKLLNERSSIAVQVNGKVRATIIVSKNAHEAEVRAQAEKDDGVASWLSGKTIKRFVYVPGRLLNFVVV